MSVPRLGLHNGGDVWCEWGESRNELRFD